MSIMKGRAHLSALTSHITFDYLGYSCGIDPLASDSFDMWYGNNVMTAHSIDGVMNTSFFGGKSLNEI